MNQGINLAQLLQEMLKTAAEEIKYPYDHGVYDLVSMNIFNDYQIDIDQKPDGPPTPAILRVFIEAVEEWQQETVVNHM